MSQGEPASQFVTVSQACRSEGYWHACMRMPGDVVFIVFGAVPLVIATIKGSVTRLRSVSNIATD